MYQLPSNPRALAPVEQGVWMEVEFVAGPLGSMFPKRLGDFFFILDERPKTAPAANPEEKEGSLVSGDRNLHRAQPKDDGALRWYDNEGQHKRQASRPASMSRAPNSRQPPHTGSCPHLVAHVTLTRSALPVSRRRRPAFLTWKLP